MKTEVHKAKENALSIRFTALAQQATLPALLVPRRNSVPIRSVAPKFQAEQVKARLAAEKERARREQERRMQQQQAARQATFTVD